MILLEFQEKDRSQLQAEIEQLKEAGAQEIRSREFQGGEEMIQLLVQLSPTVIASVTAIVITCLKTKKQVSVKSEGMEITGLSEENALAVFDKLMEREEKNAKTKTDSRRGRK